MSLRISGGTIKAVCLFAATRHTTTTCSGSGSLATAAYFDIQRQLLL